ncbi:MAG TPA: TonB-dependent receptor [Ignavibacteriales bacterium]|nr:TonB-dependent receptor [Ignavibacteriales bacterium]
MRFFRGILLISFLFISHSDLFSQQNYINGDVTDAKTKEPLMGANIVVNELKAIGATSGQDGRFRIKVPVGSYSITVSSIGYEPVVKTDVIVTTGSEAHLSVKLQEASIELGQVVVRADYFDKATKDNNLSTVVLGPEEIRRSPGSAQDFQRILQGMAGVSFSNDQTNELLVRGGSPNENLTVFDNMEIHSTNHYPNEYNSGGPINMVNVDLIEDIQFSTGGFISKYGDKLSSVMNITSREGTRNNLFNGNFNFSMAGYGAVMEGRINEGRGSWIFSARKSFLDLITGAIGLTAVPKYYDLQFKAAYDLSDIHKLSLSGIYGNDKILIDGEPESKDISMAAMADSIGLERADVKQSQYAVGLTLKSLWNKSLYSLMTVYYNNYHNDIDAVENFTERFYDSNGELANSRILKKRPLFYDRHDNAQAVLKGEFVWNISSGQEMNFGGAVGTGDFKQNLFITGNSARYLINGQWSAPIVVAPSSPVYNIRLFDNYKSYAYVNDKVKLLGDRMIVNLGLRYDYFTYSRQGNLSPRLAMTYYLVPALTNINFAYGEYYQTQSYPTYGDRYHTDINRYLKNTHARHLVLGMEHIPSEGLKITLEGYYKQYSDIPVSETFVNFNDRMLRSEKNLNLGRQDAYGIDFMIQQKLVKDIYGTLSYSRMWAKMKDPRIGFGGKEYTSDYDFPHVLTLIVGKRFSGLRDEINSMPFYIKYPSYILPFSNDMEISLRWRFASGRPYTPLRFVTTEQHLEGDTRWSKGAWVPTDEINSSRYPDYHRLDLSMNSRFNFNKWNLLLFFSIENLYNRENVALYQYNSDGSIDKINQFALFPVLGLEMEF